MDMPHYSFHMQMTKEIILFNLLLIEIDGFAKEGEGKA